MIINLLVFIIVLVLFKIIIDKYFKVNENFKDKIGYIPPQSPYDKINNKLYYVLSRPILKGNQNIDNLQEILNPILDNPVNKNEYIGETSEKPMWVTPFIRDMRKTPEKKCLVPDIPLYSRIDNRQPSIYNNPKKSSLFNLYGFPLYRDWRYPEKPISIEFATNPKKYCTKNPNNYPCYVYWRRIDLR
jgi:hypothetical protein